jgi:limonene-1,2-epoxide hydrolase
MSETLEHEVATYVAFFNGLTDESVDDLRRLASPQVRYRDPLTDRHGIDAVTDYMHMWFQTMDDLSFDVNLHAVHGNVVLSQWNMNFRIRRMPKRPWTIEGMSKISLDTEGKVTEHVDYWDATPLLQAVPLLGRVVTLTRRVVTQSAR